MVLPVFPRNIPYRARPKSPPFQFFSALRHFFSEFFSSKGPPCIFLMFCDRMDVGKSQRVPPFSFFRHCEIFSREKKFNFFFMFCDRMDVEKPQRVPLSVFRHCETLARQGLALAGPGAPLGPFFWYVIFSKKISKNFSIFEYCKRILDTWKSFCYF